MHGLKRNPKPCLNERNIRMARAEPRALKILLFYF